MQFWKSQVANKTSSSKRSEGVKMAAKTSALNRMWHLNDKAQLKGLRLLIFSRYHNLPA